MKLRVVDSNVAVVANGRDTNASLQCRAAAIDALATLLRDGRIIVDEAGEMLDEYRRYCNPRGQPGVGDRFFREIMMNYAGKIDRVILQKRANGSFIDFPDDPDLVRFDRDDRKFAAAARKTEATVINAVDSDWLIHYRALVRNGINVEFICGIDIAEWLAP